MSKPVKIIVSEHALIRYCERVLKMDFEAIKKIIVSEELKGMVNTLGGDGVYPVEEFKVVMRNHVIVTIKLSDKEFKRQNYQRRKKLK